MSTYASASDPAQAATQAPYCSQGSAFAGRPGCSASLLMSACHTTRRRSSDRWQVNKHDIKLLPDTDTLKPCSGPNRPASGLAGQRGLSSEALAAAAITVLEVWHLEVGGLQIRRAGSLHSALGNPAARASAAILLVRPMHSVSCHCQNFIKPRT